MFVHIYRKTLDGHCQNDTAEIPTDETAAGIPAGLRLKFRLWQSWNSNLLDSWYSNWIDSEDLEQRTK